MIEIDPPFCLSLSGSTRATAYNWTNKVVHLDGKTHVVWLDAIATVCGRTYDHATSQWGKTVRIGEGCDNHASPCLTADKEGYLRLTFGPHGFYGNWNQGRIKWLRSTRPGQLQDWEAEENFGYNATAASIVHTPAGFDAVVCRGGESPCQTQFHRQGAKGGWTTAKSLFIQDIEPQYTHHYGHITCAPDGTLFVACHFYNVGGGDNHPVDGKKKRMRSYGAAVITSMDYGETWTDLRGNLLTPPVRYDSTIAIPPAGEDVYVKGVVIDDTGTLWALTMNPGLASDGIWLSRWSDGQWSVIRLESHLPPARMAVDGMLTVDARNGLHIVLTALCPDAIPDKRHWGHPSCEVFHLYSKDRGECFVQQQVSPPDSSAPNWLPSISRPSPCHPVKSPLILYTRGGPGEGCRPDLQTEVWCRQVRIT